MANPIASTQNVRFVAQSMYAPAPLVVKFAKIAATDTHQDVVAAVSGRRIRVLSAYLTLTGNVDNTVAFLSGGEIGVGTSLSGTLKPLALQTDSAGAATIVLSAQDHPYGCFETVTGEKLTIDGAGTSPVAQGFLTYVEIDPNVAQ